MRIENKTKSRLSCLIGYQPLPRRCWGTRTLICRLRSISFHPVEMRNLDSSAE